MLTGNFVKHDCRLERLADKEQLRGNTTSATYLSSQQTPFGSSLNIGLRSLDVPRSLHRQLASGPLCVLARVRQHL